MAPQAKGSERRLTLVAFVCLALICGAVPVMADPVDAPVSSESVLQSSEFPVPTSAELNAAYAASRRKDEEREIELQEPALVSERENSREAYADLTSEEAEELLRSTFAQTLSSLNTESARLLSDARLDDNLGHGSAVITSEGRTELLEGALPVEVPNDEGVKEKVDVSLEAGPQGFEPENPIVDLAIGGSAEEGIEVGGEGGGEALTVTQAGADESTGRLLGDKNVFFPEVRRALPSPTRKNPEPKVARRPWNPKGRNGPSTQSATTARCCAGGTPKCRRPSTKKPAPSSKNAKKNL